MARKASDNLEIEDEVFYGVEQKPAKILIYDLEVSPLLVWTYGLWQANAIKQEDRQRLMSFSYRWYGEKKISSETLMGQDTYKVDPKNDTLIIQKLHKVMAEADLIIGHNSNQFDDKMANMFFITAGLDPIPPYKTVDTKKVAKRHFRFPSNSLNNLGEALGIGQKTDVKHSDIWYECFVLGSKKHWKLMATYNEQDVELTTKLYEKLRPFISNHPSLARIQNELDVCPKCGSDHLQSRGYRVTNISRYRRYQCQTCRGWCSARLSIPKDYDIKPKYVNAV